MATVLLPRSSRYKDTRLFARTRGEEFGVWLPPREFDRTIRQAITHVVASHEVGFLDSIAVRYYGNEMETMWWVIARVNNIVDPERDMFSGQRLILPPSDVVRGYMSRGTRRV